MAGARVTKGLVTIALTAACVALLYRIGLHMTRVVSLSFDDLTLHFMGVFAAIFALILVAIVWEEPTQR